MGIFDGAVLLCDIDGTLSESGIIPQRNIDKIEFFVSEGGHFALSTGRHFAANYDIVEKIKGLSLSVVLNGGMIYNYANNEILYEISIPKTDYHYVSDVIKSGFDCGIEVQAGNRIFTLLQNEKTNEHQKFQNLETTVITFEEAIKYDWNKVIFMLNGPDDYEKIASIIDLTDAHSLFMTTCTYIGGKKRDYFEQVPLGVTKDVGMNRLCEILNVKSGKCFAIGDYYNDIPMLKNADISATTAEAPDEIKQDVDFVGGSCKDGAVADFIEYLTKIFTN